MRSLNSKLAGLVAAAVLGAVALGSLAAAWRDAQSRLNSKREELTAFAGLLATMAGEPMSRGDKTAVARTLTAIGRRADIRYARVSDSALRSVAEFGTGVIVSRRAGPVDAAPELNPWTTIYLGTYPVTADIISGGKRLGRLVLIADLSGLRTALIDSLVSSLIAGAFVALIGIAAAFRLQRRLTAPIQRLTAAMQDVRDKRDYERAVPHASNDEIGQMVDAFNAMLAEIRARDRDLMAHRDRLELEVAERTAEYLEAKDSAEAANAAKSDFLATMSHEIRTPMNGMLVMAELMSVSGLTPRLQRYADVLVKSGQSLLAIINDILDVSKIEAGKLSLDVIEVDPRAIIDDVLKLFSERAATKGLDLAGYVSPDVPRRIAADPVRLNQILSNLVNNALKFTDQGGIFVELVTRRASRGDPARLVLSVTDSGIGLAKDKVDTIFEAFSQADQSTTRRYGGTGIGLTICRRLAEAMGGAITVRSEEGRGSEFIVDIPLTVIEAAATSQAFSHHGALALIALADGPSRRALKRVANDCGYDVAFADPAAVTVGEAAHASVILAEAHILERLGSQPPGVTARRHKLAPLAIALTRFGSSRQADGAQDGIADASLELPVSTADATALLAACMSGRTGLRALTEITSVTANAKAALKRFPGVHVLAADDGAVNRELLVEALSRLDVNVTCVENGREALAALKTGRFDLVFMDGSMPVMDGFDSCRAIRAWETEMGREAMPVIALTAHVVGEQADAWRSAGMNACITKPFTLAALHACLERWLVPGAQMTSATTGDRNVTPHSQPGVGDDADLIDHQILDDMRGMQHAGQDLVARIVALYGEHAPAAFARLTEAASSGDTLRVADAAHALKSLSLSIGATRVASLCGEIEHQAREHGTEETGAVNEELGEALNATIAALKDDAAMPAAEGATGRAASVA